MLSPWPTPSAEEFTTSDPERMAARREAIKAKGINGNGFGLTLGNAATLSAWPTPAAHDQRGARSPEDLAKARAAQAERGVSAGSSNLHETVLLAPWCTPMARDDRGELKDPKRRGSQGLELSKQAQLAPLPTVTGNDSKSGRNRTASRSNPESAHHDGVTLTDAVDLAPWATPTASEKVRSEDFSERRTLTAREALGPSSSGSSAPTAKRGQLNPAFSLWLQGYPLLWILSAPLSARRLRR